ncbi:MAG TPA: dihydrofolate reductase family protein [Solirubrobacteraceae bacterium]|nr:dihydrofolate reductase family protein [Solirubrobacteraceae bacterium]
MGAVSAAITVSLDGYVAAPGDAPGRGLGEGGERLHSWVFGGPWRYEDAVRGEPHGEDARWLAQAGARTGAVICGRWTYEAARHWGGRNPAGKPFFVLTHRPAEQPHGGEFNFVCGLEEALARAREAAGGDDVHIMGGADTIRQALAADVVEQLTLIVAPLLLGAGKRLFEGFTRSLELEQLGARQSRFATFLEYRVRR